MFRLTKGKGEKTRKKNEISLDFFFFFWFFQFFKNVWVGVARPKNVNQIVGNRGEKALQNFYTF